VSAAGTNAGIATGVSDDAELRQDVLTELKKIGFDKVVEQSHLAKLSVVTTAVPSDAPEGDQGLQPARGGQSKQTRLKRPNDQVASFQRHKTEKNISPFENTNQLEILSSLPVSAQDLLRDDDFREERWYRCIPQAMPQRQPTPRPHCQQTSTPLEDRLAVLGQEALRAASHLYRERTHRRGKLKSAPETPPQLLPLPQLADGNATLMDRIAALALSIQKSPLHHLDALNELIDLAAGPCKKRRRERWTAIEALKEAFIKDLLPPDRKLVDFYQWDWSAWYATLGLKLDRPSPAERSQCREALRVLLYATFESALKAAYTRFLIEVLTDSAQDSIEYLATRVLGAVLELLAACPEQEQALLSLLVSKLGSASRSVSSKAHHCLELLVQKHHPAMRLVVAREVLQLGVQRLSSLQNDKALRPLYLCTHFLAHIQLQKEKDADRSFAIALVSFYLSVFRKLLERRSFDSRLCTVVLEGIQHLLPIIQDVDPGRGASADLSRSLAAQIDALYLLVHRGNLETTIRALMVLLRIDKSDRFYRALYESLTSEKLWYATGPKVTAFCNICYLSMKADTCIPRLLAMVKRLLALALHTPAATAAGVLLLLSELIFRTGVEPFRTKAQMRLQGLRQCLQKGALSSMPANETLTKSIPSILTEKRDRSPHMEERKVASPSSALEPLASTAEPDVLDHANTYDPFKREPKFANADVTYWWELALLLRHHHPTVVAFADALVQGKPISYRGDPLLDHSGAAFLARLARKKAKSQAPVGQVRTIYALTEAKASRDRSAPARSINDGHVADSAFPMIRNLSEFDGVPGRQQPGVDHISSPVFSSRATFPAVARESRMRDQSAIASDRIIDAISDENDDEDAIWAAMEDSLAQQGVPLLDDDEDNDDDE
jgi:ribosome biogenesis protein MAK21